MDPSKTNISTKASLTYEKETLENEIKSQVTNLNQIANNLFREFNPIMIKVKGSDLETEISEIERLYDKNSDISLINYINK